MLDAPAEVGSSYDLVLSVTCPPVAGEKYVQIAEVQNIGRWGTRKHPIYCPHAVRQTVGTVTAPQDLTKSTVGVTRFVYILSLDDQQAKSLYANLIEGCTDHNLPDGADKVSNTVKVTRTW